MKIQSWLILLLIGLSVTSCAPGPAEMNAIANAELSQGRFEAALQAYEAALAEEPNNPVYYFNAAAALRGFNNTEQAEAALRQAIARGDDALAALAQFNLGNLAFLRSDYEAAISAYQEALRLDASFADARFNLELALRQAIEPTPTAMEMQTEPDQQSANPNATPTPNPGSFDQPTPTPPPDAPMGPTPAHGGDTGELSDDTPSTPVPEQLGELSIEQAQRILDPIELDAQAFGNFVDDPIAVPSPVGRKDW